MRTSQHRHSHCRILSLLPWICLASCGPLAVTSAWAQDRAEPARGQHRQVQADAEVQLNQNKGGPITWSEIQSAHGPALDLRGWDESYVLEAFDRNRDGALNGEEYRRFVTSLKVDDPDTAASAVGAGSDAADSHIPRTEPGIVSNPQEETNPTLATREEGGNDDRPTVYDVSIGDLEGRKVVNGEDQVLGRVDQVVMHTRREDLGLVVAAGGFLGIGARRILVEVDEVSLSPEHKLVWNTEMSKTQMREMDEYRGDNYVRITGNDFSSLRALKDSLLSKDPQNR